jgi:hypothetical protein
VRWRRTEVEKQISATSDGSVKATCWLIVLSVGIRLQEFVAI